jgi:hypothetical protein
MNLKMLCHHLKKVDVDNHQKLKSYLAQNKTWAIHQFNKDDNGNDQNSKKLFPQIPTPLVVDFFASNSIDELNLVTDRGIVLKATGIDDVQWSYLLIPPQSTP